MRIYPVFRDVLVNQQLVAEFREILTHPEVPANLEFISALLDLHAEPAQPLPEALWSRALDKANLCLNSSQSALIRVTALRPEMSRYEARLQFRLEVHDLILRHAAAAGFLPPPPLPPLLQRRTATAPAPDTETTTPVGPNPLLI